MEQNCCTEVWIALHNSIWVQVLSLLGEEYLKHQTNLSFNCMITIVLKGQGGDGSLAEAYQSSTKAFSSCQMCYIHLSFWSPAFGQFLFFFTFLCILRDKSLSDVSMDVITTAFCSIILLQALCYKHLMKSILNAVAVRSAGFILKSACRELSVLRNQYAFIQNCVLLTVMT